MSLPFYKMHGLGNDFVIFDAVRGGLPDPEQIRRIANRRLGVGCDQVLAVAESADPNADLTMQIWNADGSMAEQCGNGVRCAAVFALQTGIAHSRQLRIQTGDRIVAVECQDLQTVRVDMGAPLQSLTTIPLQSLACESVCQLQVEDQELILDVVSMGNPHAVIQVEDVEQAAVARLGAAVQALPHFPHGVNVGFMQIIDPEQIRLRVYERGAGETWACGSGACAAVVSGVRQGVLRAADSVRVLFAEGALEVQWSGTGSSVWMRGPVQSVFCGQIEL